MLTAFGDEKPAKASRGSHRARWVLVGLVALLSAAALAAILGYDTLAKMDERTRTRLMRADPASREVSVQSHDDLESGAVSPPVPPARKN